jgi:hypothetical protein
MTLEDKDILQADATIIVGALILLTLSKLFAPEKSQQVFNAYITVIAVVPFSFSAFFIELINLLPNPVFFQAALLSLMARFVHLT